MTEQNLGQIYYIFNEEVHDSVSVANVLYTYTVPLNFNYIDTCMHVIVQSFKGYCM